MFHLILMGFFFNIPYEKCNKTNTSFDDNVGQNDHVSNHFTVFTLAQRFIYLPFSCQHGAVVSYCALQAPQLFISEIVWPDETKPVE